VVELCGVPAGFTAPALCPQDPGTKSQSRQNQQLPMPRVDPQELRQVEEEYLRRYFRSKEEIVPTTAETAPVPVPREESEIRQSLSFYQPINRRERLR